VTPLSPATAPSRAERTDAPGVARCPHCGTAIEGAEDAFCCPGCEIAAAIIRGAGLERYYTEREAYAPRPEPLTAAWAGVPSEPRPDGTVSARLVVDGLRCASCVWVTEKVLERTAGVAEATVSYATGRATLRWDPGRVDLSTLAARIAALGYRPRPLGVDARPDRGLLVRLGIAAMAALGVMGLYEGIYAGWWYGGMDPRFAALFRWTSLLLATPVALWCATPFFAGAWAGLRHRMLHMDVPVALGIAVLYLHGVWATLAGRDGYLDSLTMLVALLLGGRMLEARGRRRAADAATALAATTPATARRARGDRLETVPADALRRGDLIDVGAGEELAADGIVTEGSGQLRMALLTGEAAPVLVGPGARVVAGATLLDGALTIRVDAAGRDTVLQRMAGELRAAADAGTRPTPADRIAPWFTGLTLAVAAATLVVWWVFRGFDAALATTVAVLVVACPCALALAQPLTAAAALGAAARRGLLFRSSDALLALNDITVVALDKTGTVTGGDLRVVSADDATLRLAAGLERYSNHPIARAIVVEATRREIPLPRGEGIREIPGVGIVGWLDGKQWMLASGGPGVVRIAAAGVPAREIELADTVRDDSAETVGALEGAGLEVVLLTGDHGDVAALVAQRTGISEVIAGADPAAKRAAIERLQARGERVLFAGDGINDGPALAAADLGIAMGSGAASSILVSDGVISSPALTPLLAGVRAARAAARVIRFNHAQSILYNAVAIAAAAGGLVNPLVAALLMPASSAVVIWGAARIEPMVRREER
jgi:Cu2+-exporting ATPase